MALPPQPTAKLPQFILSTAGIKLRWKSEEELMRVNRASIEVVYVLPYFAGTVFDHLKGLKCRIIGPMVVYQANKHGLRFPMSRYAVWSLGLYETATTTVGFSQDDKDEIRSMVIRLGGFYREEMTDDTKLIIACDAVQGLSQLRTAKNRGITIVKREWLESMDKAAFEMDYDKEKFYEADFINKYIVNPSMPPLFSQNHIPTDSSTPSEPAVYWEDPIPLLPEDSQLESNYRPEGYTQFLEPTLEEDDTIEHYDEEDQKLLNQLMSVMAREEISRGESSFNSNVRPSTINPQSLASTNLLTTGTSHGNISEPQLDEHGRTTTTTMTLSSEVRAVERGVPKRLLSPIKELVNVEMRRKAAIVVASQSLAQTSIQNITTSTNSEYRLIMFGVNDDSLYQIHMRRVSKLLGTQTVLDYKPSVTHAVYANLVKSEKLMSAIAAGKWIVSLDYIRDSLSCRRWLGEETYEFGNPRSRSRINSSNDDSIKIADACYRWRLKATTDPTFRGAFQNWKVLLYMRNKSAKKSIFKNVIEAGGGEVTFRENLSELSSFANYTIVLAADNDPRCTRMELQRMITNGIKCFKLEYMGYFLIENTPTQMPYSQIYHPKFLRLIHENNLGDSLQAIVSERGY
ncbi:DNA topoisomerase 2-binding protein 1 [Aphelenchoides besseyi]|nr:DNA topoisomerase 2-binding protein 1 [Aphelenchoides besseyi]